MNALVANAKSEPALAVIRSLGRKGIDITGATDYSSDFPMFSGIAERKYFSEQIRMTSKTSLMSFFKS